MWQALRGTSAKLDLTLSRNCTCAGLGQVKVRLQRAARAGSRDRRGQVFGSSVAPVTSPLAIKLHATVKWFSFLYIGTD